MTGEPCIHVVGAGMAGLSAAVHAIAAGRAVAVYESAGHAGGRCRSFYDERLGCDIDNGNHLVLSGNHAAMDYLARIGAGDTVWIPEHAEYPFLDVNTSEKWIVRPDAGVIPWSIFSRSRRVPGSRLMDYLRGFRLARAGTDETVAASLRRTGVLFERFWEPLAVAILNTPADEAAASLLWPVIRETFGRGEAACLPVIARHGLSASFVSPAVAHIEAKGHRVAFNQRLRRVSFEGDRVASLDFGDEEVPVAPADSLILAVPAWELPRLVPEISAPTKFRAIVNAHFRLPVSKSGISFIGLIGGVAEWVFVRGEIASVTVSAADNLAAESNEEIAAKLWPEVCLTLGISPGEPAAFRIIKEKRATPAQTPAQVALRPDTRTAFRNLFLAGDWTETGLPTTIEASIRSGKLAAVASISPIET